jgi:hypothetical protein
MREQLKTPGELASGPPDALGHCGELAALSRVERKDPVRLSEVSLADHNRGNAIEPYSPHWRHPP